MNDVTLLVHIREADERDMPGLVRLEEDCFADERFSPEVLRTFLVRDDAFVIVAVENDEIVGSAMCMISQDMGEGKIASIAVLRKARGAGIGSALLDECENRFRAMNLRLYTLEVEDTNEPAIALYKSRGYETRGTMKDFYGIGRHAYAMEKSVGPMGTKVTVRDA
ncbi:MAG: GNAT family N-acetyltransferase [Thermoplasmata archaeon]